MSNVKEASFVAKMFMAVFAFVRDFALVGAGSVMGVVESNLWGKGFDWHMGTYESAMLVVFSIISGYILNEMRSRLSKETGLKSVKP